MRGAIPPLLQFFSDSNNEAGRSGRAVLECTNTGVVGVNPAQGPHLYMRLSVFGGALAMG
jgi:hypothetical protein